MDLAYVCEWEKWSKSTHCPSVPLACAWSCRNLIAFTMDLRSDDQGVSPLPPASPVSRPVPQVPGTLPCGDSVSQASPRSPRPSSVTWARASASWGYRGWIQCSPNLGPGDMRSPRVRD